MDVREFFDKKQQSSTMAIRREIQSLKEEIARKTCEIQRIERVVCSQQKEINDLHRIIVKITQEKITLTEKFLNHIQERQSDDREWIENLKRKIAELPK
jgi:chromosome segregation ATPase